MRQRYIFDQETQKMVPAEEYYAKQRKANSAHGVIQDSIDPLKMPFDGKTYDSKSQIRAAARANGLIELGDEPIGRKAPTRPEGVRDSLERTYHTMKDMTPETRRNYMERGGDG